MAYATAMERGWLDSQAAAFRDFCRKDSQNLILYHLDAMIFGIYPERVATILAVIPLRFKVYDS
ncbi:MAG: hypothetical protein LIO70_09425 [Clostridiales bacterium]|nr:hypothetical protein [Clostridiales bacterium]